MSAGAMSVPTVKCEICGRAVSAYADKCVFCGSLRGPRCPYCLEPVKAGAARCSHCQGDFPEPAQAGSVVVGPVIPEAAEPSRSADVARPSRAKAATATAVIVLVAVVGVYMAKAASRAAALRRARDEVLSARKSYLHRAENQDYRGAIAACEDTLAQAKARLTDDPIQHDILSDLRDLHKRESASEDRRRRSHAESRGYRLCGDLGVKVLKIQPGLHDRRPCLDLWVGVCNLRSEAVAVSSADFAVKLEDGRTVAPEKAVESFHLGSAQVGPEEEVSGVVPFRAKKEELRRLVFRGEHALPIGPK